ncbi:hypothetical protein FS749_013070 [Ceratobasidium sp. UAMH 11750]|nr:hypothetical protein FS749_013070 [Ceratobasidium sp. UAMH 11750]
MDPLTRDYKLPELHTNAFPSLKHFGLYQIPDPAVFQMVWGSSALVKDLTSVKLLAAPKFFSYSNTKFSDALAEFLAVLAEQSPSLRGLWVRVQDPKLDRPSYDVPLITLASLQKLPLQKLYIEGINFSDYPYDEDDTEDNEFVGPRFDFVKYFSTSFPALKELGFPNHRAALTDSRMFCALLPRLESLRFDFDLDFAQWEPNFDLNEIPRHRNSPFRIFEANFLGICENEEEDNGLDITDLDYDDGVGLAHYLFSLWPNVRLAPQLEEDESKDHASHEKMIVSINNYLAELSCCNRDASIKYEDIKALDWAHGRIPRRGLLHLSPQEFYFSD